MERLELSAGCVVLIDAFDDVPEHEFRVDEIHEEFVCGQALTGPLAGEYGEPEIAMIRRVIARG